MHLIKGRPARMLVLLLAICGAGVTDLRRGFVGLSAQVQTALEENPFSGQVCVFRGRRGDLVKQKTTGSYPQ